MYNLMQTKQYNTLALKKRGICVVCVCARARARARVCKYVCAYV